MKHEFEWHEWSKTHYYSESEWAIIKDKEDEWSVYQWGKHVGIYFKSLDDAKEFIKGME